MSKDSNFVPDQKQTKEYLKITFKNRKQLIRLVEEEKISIKKSCQKLYINYSTGKLIIKNYRKCGKITIFSYQNNQTSSSPQGTIIFQNNQNLKKQTIKQSDKFHEHDMYENCWTQAWTSLNQINFHQNIPFYGLFLWCPTYNNFSYCGPQF